ncbi:MAG: Homoserine kinase [Firmicutes bacterium]|nr:Homoserine kinase [Bacillota bacterium]
MAKSVKVRVPGTTANCGPGFDAIGIACTIYNEMTLTLSDDGKCLISITGEGEGLIPSNDKNVAFQAVRLVLERLNQPYTGIRINMHNFVPLARGLGSSAAAIVAGLVAANAVTGNQLTREDILDMATSMEGHPDNVAPAIFGGITVSIMNGNKPYSLKFMPAFDLKMVVAIPDFTLSTRAARQVLPQEVLFQDAIFNVSRSALLIAALCEGRTEFLKYALEDRLHQPYRQKLIPGMADVLKAAVSQGAFGATLSGAGPCLIAYTKNNETEIGEAMVRTFASHNISARFIALNIDSEGAKVIDIS